MLKYRPALPSDARMIVDLHVSMSQNTYAHILPEAYLKDILPAEKQELWQTRCAVLPSPDHLIIIACDGAEIAGFCCFVFNEETEFGTYLHNLYVSPVFQGKGVAKTLLREALSTLENSRKDLPVHLVAFAKNIPATAVYDRLGGLVIERREVTRAGNPGVELVRYQWPTAHDLLDKLAA
ncbi:GNAT family N-acetyltransferase [Rhizobium sp.]|uniref:GNAT family N-acetyltransferase n=1 Tax=Rhizobium sp. TaxID=391 RepID=UPI0028B121DF